MPEMNTQPPISPKQQPSLTELSTANEVYGRDLLKHTKARNYLWQVASGELPLPIVKLEASVPELDEVPECAMLDMQELPPEATEFLLTVMIEHEEKAAIQAWNNIAVNAAQAVNLITQLKSMQKTQEEDNRFPSTVPMTKETS